MTQYNSANMELSNEQFKKLKSEIKNGTEVTLNTSSNVIRDFNDETTSFPQKLLLTLKLFATNSLANIKLFKSQLSKLVHLGRFLKTSFCLMKNVIKPLAKSILIPLKLTAAELAAVIRIPKKILGSGMTTLIISTGSI